MNISKRIKFIATFVKKDMVIADIGSDHGFLPYYLLEKDVVDKIYASDNKRGPFNNLVNTFKDRYKDKITIALKDGLDDLPPYINTVSICGMGGELIKKIIDKNIKYIDQIEYFLLSPHNDIDVVREYLNYIGYTLSEEGIVFDEKYYHVLLYKKGRETLSKIDYIFGPILLKNKNELFINYWKERLNEYENILLNPNLNLNRRKELEKMVTLIKENAI